MAAAFKKHSATPAPYVWNPIKEFTDRQDPQEAFERKFRAFSADWKDNAGCVLCYYGIGGIGKTSLINKLRRLTRSSNIGDFILHHTIDCHTITYEFDKSESGKDKLTILRKFRNQLGELDSSFLFSRFDAAIVLHAKKTGTQIEKDAEYASILDNNPWLNSLVSTAGLIPSVNWISNIFQIVDAASILWQKVAASIGQSPYEEFLEEIDDLEPSELIANLHTYFMMDMCHNMLYISKKPLVVFLDAYEIFTDMTNEDITVINIDHWLRKSGSSLIQGIPGVMWVIGSRDKLYWSKDDDWDELLPERPLSQMSEQEKEELAGQPLEQHLLGDLSLNDTSEYLKKAGVLDETLYPALHQLTNGTPIYLYYCIFTYHSLKNKKKPVIEDFGNDINQLINRYYECMTYPNREMACFLACLGKWDDNTVKEIQKKAVTLRYVTYSDYKSFLSHSFIIDDLDGTYHLHRTFRDTILLKVSDDMAKELSQLHLPILKEKFETTSSSDSNSILSRYTDSLIENVKYHGYETFVDVLSTIREKFCALGVNGYHDLYHLIANKLFYSAVANHPGTIVEWITRSQYAKSLCLLESPSKGLDLLSGIPWDTEITEKDEMYWVWIKNDAADVFRANAKYAKALELRKQVLTTCLNVLSERHVNTIKAMSNLAIVYGKLQNHQEALAWGERAFNLSQLVLGDKDLTTLSLMNNLANTHSRLGNHQEAFDLRKRVFEERMSLLGDHHLNTIRSMRLLYQSYQDIGDLENAALLHDKLHSLYEQQIEKYHPFLLSDLKNQEYESAINNDISKLCEHRKAIFRIAKKYLGIYHSDTLDAVMSLASTYDDMEEFTKACELQEEAVAISQVLFKKNSLRTFETRFLLSHYYERAGNSEKAESIKQQLRNEGWEFD